ncbi:MAG: hypothetical protein E6R03_10480 [Hyphomicrobiaceae bacterium]|nr:MAG: hypothetical protein E6R03_10480 [Hyphomicrobiaceae bacterium]
MSLRTRSMALYGIECPLSAVVARPLSTTMPVAFGVSNYENPAFVEGHHVTAENPNNPSYLVYLDTCVSSMIQE